MKTENIIKISFAAVFAVLLYCFASSFRYKEMKGMEINHTVGEHRSEYMYYEDWCWNRECIKCRVFLDTWRGRLCYFDQDGRRHYENTGLKNE